MSKVINAYGVEVNESAVWLDDQTCILREGGKINFKLTGIIRGEGLPPFTYFFHSYRQLESFVLCEWVYYIKAV